MSNCPVLSILKFAYLVGVAGKDFPKDMVARLRDGYAWAKEAWTERSPPATGMVPAKSCEGRRQKGQNKGL